LGELTPHNLKQLKLINEVIFPMPYSPQVKKAALVFCTAFFKPDSCPRPLICRAAPLAPQPTQFYKDALASGEFAKLGTLFKAPPFDSPAPLFFFGPV
jgi:hypothetical protein